jgi:hypothetical protein
MLAVSPYAESTERVELHAGGAPARKGYGEAASEQSPTHLETGRGG